VRPAIEPSDERTDDEHFPRRPLGDTAILGVVDHRHKVFSHVLQPPSHIAPRPVPSGGRTDPERDLVGQST
jgi:hypothetical protein